MSTLFMPAPQAPSRRSLKARKVVVPQQRRQQERPPSSGKMETFFLYGSLAVGAVFFTALWYLLHISIQ
jgi:hypothetical protein